MKRVTGAWSRPNVRRSTRVAFIARTGTACGVGTVEAALLEWAHMVKFVPVVEVR
jgi:hypothetical protein